MNSPKLRPTPIIVPAVLLIGFAIGLLLRPTVNQLILSSHVEDLDDPHGSEQPIDVHEIEDDEPHIALTQQAYQNLNLSISPIELSDYTQTIRMPGEIQESPGYTIQQVTAPVSGTVTRLFAIPGISVTEGIPLFELAIIDDDLMDAQLRLLELLTRREIVDAEINRLAPLVKTGSVIGRKLLDWEYQKKEVVASLSRTRQELTMRGLTTEQIENIVTGKRAISRLIVTAPQPASELVQSGTPQLEIPQSEVQLATWPQAVGEHTDLTVEEILADIGQNIGRGDVVCTLAGHGMLLVCGYAFENEVNSVAKLMHDSEPVEIEFGIEGYCSSCNGLTVQYIDSHVDPQSQTYRFFIPLPNQVATESTDAMGRRFRTWKYKVGQRVHALIPESEIQDHLVLPRDAVVQEGPDAFVFREHIDHPMTPDLANADVPVSSQTDQQAHKKVYVELEPVPVTIVHRDKSVAVVVPDGELTVGDRVAMGSAYQLLLALKAEQDGGGGHHHHH